VEKIIVCCNYCGKKFETTEYRISVGRGKYCSRSCSAKARIDNRNPNWKGGRYVERICVVCGKKFYPTKYQVENGNGRTCSDDCRHIEHSLLLSGENAPLWKGGITPEKHLFYNRREWKALIKKVWKRDKSICQRCGRKGKRGNRLFDVHHIVPVNVEEFRLDIDNLVLLCHECHLFVHSSENVGEIFIQ